MSAPAYTDLENPSDVGTILYEQAPSYTDLETKDYVGGLLYEETPPYNDISPAEQVASVLYEEEPRYDDITGPLVLSKVFYRRILMANLMSVFFNGEEAVEGQLDRPAVFSMMAREPDGPSYSAGGLGTYGVIYSDVDSYGETTSTFEADRDYLVLIAMRAGQEAYVVDDQGNRANTIRGASSLLLPKGWRIVSREPFKVIVLPV